MVTTTLLLFATLYGPSTGPGGSHGGHESDPISVPGDVPPETGDGGRPRFGGRIRVTGHASKWVCGALTMLTQASASYAADSKAIHRLGGTDVAIPGEAYRFVRWTIEGLAREKPRDLRIAGRKKRKPVRKGQSASHLTGETSWKPGKKGVEP